MKSIFKYFSALMLGLVLSFLPGALKAQVVTNAQYYLKYNTTFCYYEAHMVVTAISSGTTVSGANVDAAACQFSFVVPHGTVLTKVSDNQPVNKVTSVPNTWNLPSNRLNAPTVNPSVDFIAATLNVSNGAYPSLSVSSDLILFRFTLSSTTCGAGVRMWVNNAFTGNPDPGASSTWDPVPSAAGMGFNDFNNSFTLGTVTTERYLTGNAASSVTPPNPTITSVSASCAGGNFALTGVATAGTACATPVSYAWSGPSSFSATGSTFTRVSPTSAMTGNYGLTATDNNGCKATTVSCFNALSCATCIVALSVKLNTFTGTADKCNASLSWEASDLAGVRDFEVQYSSDGNTFVTVGTVNTDQSIGGFYSYHYTPQIGGKGFYRLKVVDASGTDTYSQTIVVSTDCKGQIITVSPNPTNGVVYVKGVSAGDQVRVVDMLGQTVGSVIATGNVASTDLNRLPAAVYMVIVTQGQNTIIVGQVVKQ